MCLIAWRNWFCVPVQVQVIGTPIQLSSLQGIQGIQGLVKMEQGETTSSGPTGTLTITPVSGGHAVSLMSCETTKPRPSVIVVSRIDNCNIRSVLNYLI